MILKFYWEGLSWRMGGTLIALPGLKIDRYYVGYAFDYTTNSIGNYSSGSHEIMLGIDFGKAYSGNTLF